MAHVMLWVSTGGHGWAQVDVNGYGLDMGTNSKENVGLYSAPTSLSMSNTLMQLVWRRFANQNRAYNYLSYNFQSSFEYSIHVELSVKSLEERNEIMGSILLRENFILKVC